ncbi:hypothetical protein C6366_15345 [Desulfonatronum sp. SC1]|nr:hypothetical protein C6366_15345 [Desulfonatronum sp. SC1]
MRIVPTTVKSVFCPRSATWAVPTKWAQAVMPGLVGTFCNITELCNFPYGMDRAISQKNINIQPGRFHMNIWSRKIWAITAMAALGCLLTIGAAGAYDQDDLDKLLQTNECRKCDLSGVRLNGADLSRADLTGVDLTGAMMTGVVLWKAAMGGAKLSGATLVAADLAEANLNGANLSGAYMSKAYLDKTNFVTANLSGTDLYGAELYKTNLSGANLSGADLFRAFMHSINLSGAILSGAKWTNGKICAEGSIGECK